MTYKCWYVNFKTELKHSYKDDGSRWAKSLLDLLKHENVKEKALKFQQEMQFFDLPLDNFYVGHNLKTKSAKPSRRRKFF